jgi:sialate O-acetylesterase
MRKLLPALILALLTANCHAVTVADIFGDNMVLQREQPDPVWGWADPNETVTITFDNQTYTAKPDSSGKWMTKLNPHRAGGPFEITIKGKNSITIKNILVGEVWLCSGQSNMTFSVMIGANARAEIAAAKFPNIRLFTAGYQVAPVPQQHLAVGNWVQCSPATVGSFSAVAYYFGRSLHQQLDCPVGLVLSGVSGTYSEAWTSPEMLASNDEGKAFIGRWQKEVAAYEPKLAKFVQEIGDWQPKAAAAEAKGQFVPAEPRMPQDPRTSPHRPSSLYNGMISPLIPFAIRGAIWYQGENNASHAWAYRTIFPSMIEDWRSRWGQGDFAFLFVQLANYGNCPSLPGESNWAELREAQAMTLALANTGMAVTIDIGQCENIHPINKQDVGKRLALAALVKVYGKNTEGFSPLYDSMLRHENRITVKFKNTYRGLKISDGSEPTSFAIAGNDRKFVPANAKIEKDTVIVWSDSVKDPVAVRYGWADCPNCNLYNNAGLPASPFRTDDWPALTTGQK